MTSRIFAAAACALVIMSAAPAGAQPTAVPRWGSPSVPRDGACFYRDRDFRGEYFCTPRGQDLRNLPNDMNNEVSSIRLFGGNSVTVFQEQRFRGPSARFDTDVRDLRSEGWGDRISSIRVAASTWGGRGGGRVGGPGFPPVWGKPRPPRNGACFYRDANYRGDYFCIERGGSYADVPAGFNDRISSVRVMGAAVMIFRDRDYRGRSTRVSRDVPNLGGTWGDTVSSIRVF